MSTCSPQSLLNAGIGFERLVNDGDAMAVMLYQLSNIAGTGQTVQQLLTASGQFRYLEPADAKAVFNQQLCNLSGGNP